MAYNALYYPFIHVRDLLWLKGTLLLFRQVRRMIQDRRCQTMGQSCWSFSERREVQILSSQRISGRPVN